MPNWRKIITSGSDAQLNSLNLNNGATGSFTGSFIGDGSELTGITATTTPGGSDSQIQYNNNQTLSGASNFVYNDQNQRVGIGTSQPKAGLDVEDVIASNITVNRKSIDSQTVVPPNTNGALIGPVSVNSNLEIGLNSDIFIFDSTDIDGSELTDFSSSYATGSFTGSFIGDGSQLTGITATSSPGGLDSQMQYNNQGITSGATGFVYDDVNQRVGIGTTTPTEKLTIQGSISASGAIYDNIGSPGTLGQMIQSTGTGFNWVDNIAEASQDLLISGKNMTGTTIQKGTPLYFSGSNTSGNVVGVYPADAGNPNRMPAGGVAAESLGADDEGDVYIYGFINGVDTSGFSSGDTIFVGVGGGYTNTIPTGSALIQKLGNVERVDNINGSGVIQGPSWYNDLPNWEEGKIKVGVSNGQPTTSSVVHLDETNQRVGIGITTPTEKLHVAGKARITTLDNGTGDFATISNTGILTRRTPSQVLSDIGAQSSLTNPLTGTGTINFLPKFTGTSTLGNSSIFDNGTNIGIGTTSPSEKLEVNGNTRVSNGSLGVNVVPNSTNGTISASGDIIAFASDIRLKTNYKSIHNPLDKIKSLEGFTYNWNKLAKQKAGFNTKVSNVGVSAQDVRKILPEAVKLAPFDNDGDNKSISGEEYLTVQYDKIIPLLIEGMKEQQTTIDKQQNQIESLQSQINELVKLIK